MTPRLISLPAADVLVETLDLSSEEFSVYMHLLLNLWLRGGQLPDDPQRLAAFAKVDREAFDRAWQVVRRFFDTSDGAVTQQRLNLDLERARARTEAAAEKGRKGGQVTAGVKRQCSIPGLEAFPPPPPDEPEGSPQGGAQGAAGGQAELGPSSTTRPRARKKRPLRKSGSGSENPSLRSGSFAPFGRILSLFSDLWSEKYRQQYQPTPKDKSHLGRVVATFASGEEMAAYPWRAVFSSYLADDDKFVAGSHRHSLAWFCSSGGVNKYRVADRTRGFTSQDIENSAAKREWLANGRTR